MLEVVADPVRDTGQRLESLSRNTKYILKTLFALSLEGVNLTFEDIFTRTTISLINRLSNRPGKDQGVSIFAVTPPSLRFGIPPVILDFTFSAFRLTPCSERMIREKDLRGSSFTLSRLQKSFEKGVSSGIHKRKVFFLEDHY